MSLGAQIAITVTVAATWALAVALFLVVLNT